jgi:hypothetical protein
MWLMWKKQIDPFEICQTRERERECTLLSFFLLNHNNKSKDFIFIFFAKASIFFIKINGFFYCIKINELLITYTKF